jgi:hypothetical protein
MQRTRHIRPSLAKNERLADLGPQAQFLFAMLPTLADKEGRLEDRPRRIKAEIFPYYDVDIDALLDALASCDGLARADAPFIARYVVAGQRLIQIVKFAEHQQPHHMEAASQLPSQQELAVDEPSTKCEQNVNEPSTVRHSSTSSSTSSSSSPSSKNKNKSKTQPRAQQVAAADVRLPPSFAGRPDVVAAIADWLAFKAARGQRYTSPDYFARKVAEFAAAGPDAFVAAVNHSIGNNYAGLFASRNGAETRGSPDPLGTRAAIAEFLSGDENDGE